MFDSVDLGYFRKYGEIKISDEKFIENFTRRFAESVNMAKDYVVVFDNIVELPPKVTVKIGSSEELIFTEEDFDMINELSGILESMVALEENDTEPRDCDIIFIPGHMEQKVTYVPTCVKTGCNDWGYITEDNPDYTMGVRYYRRCSANDEEYKVYWKCQLKEEDAVEPLCRPGDTIIDVTAKLESCIFDSSGGLGSWECLERTCLEYGYLGDVNDVYIKPHYLITNCEEWS